MSLLILPHDVLHQICDHLDLSHPFFTATRDTVVAGSRRRKPVTELITKMLTENSSAHVFEYIRKNQDLYSSIEKRDRQFAIFVLEYMNTSQILYGFRSLFVHLTHYYTRSSQRNHLIDLHYSFKNMKDKKHDFWKLLNMCPLLQFYNYKCGSLPSSKGVCVPEYISELEEESK